MASGHVTAFVGRTHGRTDQYCTREESPCQLGAVHTDRDLIRGGHYGQRSRDRIRSRTHGRTDQYCTREESPCKLGAVHTWPSATYCAATRPRSLTGHSGS